MKHLAFLLALLLSVPCWADQGLYKAADDRSYENMISGSQFQLVTGYGPASKPSNSGSGAAPTFTATAVSNVGPGNVISVTVTPSSSNQIFPHALVQLSGSGLPTGVSPYKSDPFLTQTTALHILTTTGSPVSSFTALAPYPYVGAWWTGIATGTLVTRADLAGVSGDGPDQWQKNAQMPAWLEDDPVNVPPMAVRSLALQKTIAGEQDLSQTLSPTLVRELQGNPLTVSFTVIHKIHSGSKTWRPWVSINGGAKIYGSAAPGFGQQYVQQIIPCVPTNATTLVVGISFDGASGDVYYVANPMAAKAFGLPKNYYSQRREVHFMPKVSPANTLALYNASYTFSNSQTVNTLGGGNQPGFAVDIFGDTEGMLHWSISGFEADLEVKSASSFAGKAVTFFAYDGFEYLPYTNNFFPQLSSQTISWETFVPVNGGRFAISGSSGLALFNCNIDIFNYYLGY